MFFEEAPVYIIYTYNSSSFKLSSSSFEILLYTEILQSPRKRLKIFEHLSNFEFNRFYSIYKHLTTQQMDILIKGCSFLILTLAHNLHCHFHIHLISHHLHHAHPNDIKFLVLQILHHQYHLLI